MKAWQEVLAGGRLLEAGRRLVQVLPAAVQARLRLKSHTLVLMHAAGGATKSDLWLQIHADVSNLPLILTQ
jgi:sugar (pentulose or hexulose) kinase